jgi:type IV secretory pathway component VirB8
MGPQLVMTGYGGYGQSPEQDYQDAIDTYKDTLIIQENTIQSLEKSANTWRLIAGIAGGGFVLATIFGLYQWSKTR